MTFLRDDDFSRRWRVTSPQYFALEPRDIFDAFGRFRRFPPPRRSGAIAGFGDAVTSRQMTL